MIRFVFYLIWPVFLFSSFTFAAEKTIGVIMPGDISYYKDVHSTFVSKLDREGYAGKVNIILQKPYPGDVSLSNAARKFVAFDVDVIVTYGGPATLAAMREKTRIPIVYTAVYEPCNLTKARNVTGICSKAFVSSLLRYLRALTTISTLGVIYSSSEEDSLQQNQELLRLSTQYGFKIEEINIRGPQDVKLMLPAKKLDALFITNSSIAGTAFSSIMEFSKEQKIPTASFFYDKTLYATVVLAPAPKEQGEKAAEKVMKILGGISPDKIKTDISSQTDLIFNLKEARNMGFKIPVELMTEATRLIQ